jgi:cytochrome c-type biogenesis protein CcmH/NrfG
MKTRFKGWITLLCGVLVLGFSPLWAQKPKSQKEAEALQAVMAAKNPDDQVKAIENVLTNFADTEYKIALLQVAMQLESQKGDLAQITFYAERLLDADPKNAFAFVTLAGETARRTRENDLDKEEQLTKVNKWAKAGIEAAKTLPKPRPDMTDDQLEALRKDLQSQAYVAMGMAATLRKKNDDAITNYKQAAAVAATPDSTIWVRLGQAYMDSGKFDDAGAAFDKALSDPTAPEQVKQIAQAKKTESTTKKAGTGAKPPGGL